MPRGRWIEQTRFPVSELAHARRSRTIPFPKVIDRRSHRRRATSAKKDLFSPSPCSNLLISQVKPCLCYFVRWVCKNKWQRHANKAREKSMMEQETRSKKEKTTIQTSAKTPNRKSHKEKREAQSQRRSYPRHNPMKDRLAKESPRRNNHSPAILSKHKRSSCGVWKPTAKSSPSCNQSTNSETAPRTTTSKSQRQ